LLGDFENGHRNVRKALFHVLVAVGIGRHRRVRFNKAADLQARREGQGRFDHLFPRALLRFIQKRHHHFAGGLKIGRVEEHSFLLAMNRHRIDFGYLFIRDLEPRVGIVSQVGYNLG
jgi:hypothetical protein